MIGLLQCRSSRASNGDYRLEPAGPNRTDTDYTDHPAAVRIPVGCSSGRGHDGAFHGTLESGWAAIGGEHTGWVLRNEDEAGSSIEVDVSCCAVQATALDGTRITVTGRWIDKRYVERGTVRILMAERVEAADG